MYHLGQETGWRWVSQGVGLSSLGMLGLESHSPTSSYGCQKQNNAKAHNPREGTPGPGWGVEKGEPGVWGAMRAIWAQRGYILSSFYLSTQSSV